MATDMLTEEKIQIKDLLLWDENSRLTDNLFGKNQQEIIDTFLGDEKKFLIKSLASEIANDVDLIQLERLVVIGKGGRYVVYEGNRRLVVYKCLADPSLAGNHADFFRGLNSNKSITLTKTLDCIVTDSIDTANRYIERKHLKNNNEKSWGQVERDRHSVRTRKNGDATYRQRTKRAAIAGLVDKVDLPDQMKKDVLSEGKVTNFYRIIDSGPGVEFFGYCVLEDGTLGISDEGLLLKKLKAFVYDLLTNKPASGESWSRAYNKTEEKQAYLEALNFDDTRIDNINKEIEDSKVANLFGEEEIDIKQQGKTIYTNSRRKIYQTLIKPTTKRLKLSKRSEKINEIHKELQKIVVKDCPTATSILVRALLEVTVHRYLESKGEKFDGNNNLVVTDESNKTQLKEKINYISATYAVNNANVKGVISALNSQLYTQNLNQVVHNIGYFADESSIRKFWKNIEVVFDFLIQGIIEAEENDKNKNP